jgi:branched-subunit amino acid aminotransferase/4-amino-4-deoxychorismate lyase
MSHSTFWYNGQAQTGDRIQLSITDPGLLYGATHFTTLRIYDQTLSDDRTHWQLHLDRLRQTPPHFTPPNWKAITEGLELLSRSYEVLRITLFSDGRELITGRSLPDDLLLRQTQGISALLLPPDQSRSLPQFKSGNYLAPWLALQDAKTQNCGEAIFTDRNGQWLETTTGNLWGYANNTWYTPPLSAGILPGIKRSSLITQFKSQNQTVHELPWTPDLIAQFETIAYSNCVVEFIPIHTILITINPATPKPIDTVVAWESPSAPPTAY